jgi:hypothetical protein
MKPVRGARLRWITLAETAAHLGMSERDARRAIAGADIETKTSSKDLKPRYVEEDVIRFSEKMRKDID